MIPGVVNVFERMMTDGMKKLIKSRDPMYPSMEAIEIVSALERGCQFLYSGDKRKLRLFHQEIGISFVPSPTIPEEVVKFIGSRCRVNSDQIPELTFVTNFNTPKLLQPLLKELYETISSGSDIDQSLNVWLAAFEVLSCKYFLMKIDLLLWTLPTDNARMNATRNDLEDRVRDLRQRQIPQNASCITFDMFAVAIIQHANPTSGSCFSKMISGVLLFELKNRMLLARQCSLQGLITRIASAYSTRQVSHVPNIFKKRRNANDRLYFVDAPILEEHNGVRMANIQRPLPVQPQDLGNQNDGIYTEYNNTRTAF